MPNTLIHNEHETQAAHLKRRCQEGFQRGSLSPISHRLECHATSIAEMGLTDRTASNVPNAPRRCVHAKVCSHPVATSMIRTTRIAGNYHHGLADRHRS